MKNEAFNEEERLMALKGGNPFSVPNDYFSKLPADVSKRINELPDLNASSEINTFKTPAGYFDRLPEEIKSKVSGETRDFIYRGIKLRPVLAASLASALIAIAGLLYFINLKQQTMPLQDLTAEEIKNSLYIYSIDEQLIIDAIPKRQAHNGSDSFEEYLIENNIDVSQIVKEL